MRRLLFTIHYLLFTFLLLTIAFPVHAEVNIADAFTPALAGFTSIGFLVNVLVPNLLIIAGIIAFIAVILTGIKVISSAGDVKGQEASKGAFTAAIIGLIIIFGAYFFLQIAETIVGRPLLTPQLQ